MNGALLVTMPFGGSQRPAIGLSLLKAALVRDGLPCDIQYLNLRFAERIGGAWYEQIANQAPYLMGEWIFAPALFGDQIPPAERYFSELVHRPLSHPAEHDSSDPFGPERIGEILAVREQVGPFIDECLAAVAWEQYALVGFTTTFQQNVASLALARRIKERYPHLPIVFGGANCEGEMGRALHRLFPFVDYVCSGEGDIAFPLLARRVLMGEPVGEIPGIIQRVAGETVAPRKAGAPVLDMDSLPVPDYDDYMQQRAAVRLGIQEQPRLQIETSRGCWWGQKSHCTFCGLNGLTMQFRAKSPERALAELTELVDRYQMHTIDAVDNIIDMRYLRDVLPRLEELDLQVQLFYETKANLRKEQVRLLADTGVVQIQPGIESLSTNVLRLMRKGVSALQNIQLLRWCAEAMVDPLWNLIAGFPGEDPADYARQAEIVPLLTHLPPPMTLGRLRLDRFSPLFEERESMGVRNVRAYRAYPYIYALSAEDLAALAYHFDFDYADGRDVSSYLVDLEREMGIWNSSANHGQLTSLPDGDTLLICDTRAIAVQGEYRLRGLRRAAYEHCDQARGRAQIEAHLATLPPALTPDVADDADLDTVLDELVAAKLTLYEDGRYLSLAVDATYHLEYLAPRYLQGLPVPPRMHWALARLLDPAAPALTALFAERLVSPSLPPATPLVEARAYQHITPAALVG